MSAHGHSTSILQYNSIVKIQILILHTALPTPPSFSRVRTHVRIIVRTYRTFDTVSPLMHEYTYQAMVTDLLTVRLAPHYLEHYLEHYFYHYLKHDIKHYLNDCLVSFFDHYPSTAFNQYLNHYLEQYSVISNHYLNHYLKGCLFIDLFTTFNTAL